MRFLSFDDSERWSVTDWIKFSMVVLAGFLLVLGTLHEWDVHLAKTPFQARP
jgi:hypothetical protein